MLHHDTPLFHYHATFLVQALPVTNSCVRPGYKLDCPCHPPAFIGGGTDGLASGLPPPTLMFENLSVMSDIPRAFPKLPAAVI